MSLDVLKAKKHVLEDNSELSKTPDFEKHLSSVPDTEADSVPLNSSWTFWLDKATHGATQAEYEAGLRKIYTVSTVQGFWRVFNNIPSVGELDSRYGYHVMRDSFRKPLWEQPCNIDGGCWKFRCPKMHTEDVWKELLLASIGEQLNDFVAESDSICGVSVTIRDRDDLVQIWHTNAAVSKEAKVLEKVHSLLPDVHFLTELYKPHKTHYAFEGK